MFEINDYLSRLLSACRASFGERLVYLGLQGSYLRGEAKESSDIDVMLVLDRFTVADMGTYRGILQELGQYERSCGFICGRDELRRWNPLESVQLRYTTKDLFGTLSDLLPPATREDEIRYVQFSLGNLYHELCHRYIHANREENLRRFPGTCKGFFFLLQNLCYLETGTFPVTKKALWDLLSPEDRAVLSLGEGDFDRSLNYLFSWCQGAFARLEKLG